MGLLLYCILSDDAPPPRDVTGLAGAPVEAVQAPGLTCWVSASDGPIEPSLDTIRRHNAVVEAALDVATPIPVRYGQWFRDEDALHRAIAEKETQYAAELGEIEGCVEFGVRVVATQETEAGDTLPKHAGRESSAGSHRGREHMRALARREARRSAEIARGREFAAIVANSVAQLVRDERVDAEPERGTVAVAHLVRKENAEAYRRSIERIETDRPDVRAALTGPWPPYSFVS